MAAGLYFKRNGAIADHVDPPGDVTQVGRTKPQGGGATLAMVAQTFGWSAIRSRSNAESIAEVFTGVELN